MTQPPGCGIPGCGTPRPARLYPAGWRCGPHAPDPGVAVTVVPPGARTRPAPQPGPCRYCGKPAHRADDLGTVHECCLAWRHVITSGHPCPACQVAAIVARTGRLPDRLPPLPAVLPDGTPYVPDPPAIPRCAACGQAMTVRVPGQRFHPLCQPADTPGAQFQRAYHFQGWTPPPARPALVVDPFGGTGTTALAAAALGRTGITIDRSADYCRLARWRTTDPGERARALGLPKPPPVPDGQDSMFDMLGETG